MDYFLQFHWWYLLIALVLLVMFTGKHKGGVVEQKFTANLQIHDDRFKDCKLKAYYAIFKQGKPDHIDIEIERLTIPEGDDLELYLNGKPLAKVKVKRNNKAKFDHWGDEGVNFPKVSEGDELVISYQGAEALKGTFRSS